MKRRTGFFKGIGISAELIDKLDPTEAGEPGRNILARVRKKLEEEEDTCLIVFRVGFLGYGWKLHALPTFKMVSGVYARESVEMAIANAKGVQRLRMLEEAVKDTVCKRTEI